MIKFTKIHHIQMPYNSLFIKIKKVFKSQDVLFYCNPKKAKNKMHMQVSLQ